MDGLLAACRGLAAAGCTELLLDGSFVTEKPMPGDYDETWEIAGVDVDRVDPVFLDAGMVWEREPDARRLVPASGPPNPERPSATSSSGPRGRREGVVLELRVCHDQE